MVRALLVAAVVTAAFTSAAAAGDAKGEWARDDGRSKVRIVSCGAALCGSVSWLRDPKGPARVGQQVFFDMRPAGENIWTGKALNPDDGRTYSGKMAMSGDRLVTAGCVLGGLICKSVSWTRAR